MQKTTDTTGQSYYVLTTAEYAEVVRNRLYIRELENGGVDNWEWYGDSLKEYWEATDLTDEELIEKHD